jgi:hypothetical protein
MNFILNTISGIFSTAICAFIAWLTKSIWLNSYYSDIAKVFKSTEKANEDINKEILKTTFIKILSLRGNSIVIPDKCGFPNLWADKNKEIEIILSSPDNAIVIEDRSNVLKIQKDEYKLILSQSIDMLNTKKNTFKHLSFYTHMENLTFKLIILEHCIYVFYFLPVKSVHKSQALKYKSNTNTYEVFNFYYENLKKTNQTKKIFGG